MISRPNAVNGCYWNLSGSLAKGSRFRRIGQRLSDESAESDWFVQDSIAGTPLRVVLESFRFDKSDHSESRF